jgi:hypothetical protein
LVQEQYSKRSVTHKKLRSIVESVARERVTANGSMQKPKLGRPSSDERLNGEPHFIDRKEKVSVTCVVGLCKAKELHKKTVLLQDM